MLKYIVFRINQINSFEKECSVHAKSGFRNSACDITVSFHSSLSREEYRHSSVAFGSTLLLGIRYHSEIRFDVISAWHRMHQYG